MIQPRYLAIKRSVETARHVRIPTPGKRSAILRIASTSTPRYLHSQGTAANDVAETVISTAPSPSLLLGAFVGLPLTLWVYKCLMMVVFQRKIIYMGYIPPGARTETLEKEDPLLSRLEYKELIIKSDERVTLSGYIFRRATVAGTAKPGAKQRKRAVFVYFQGNVGSPIQRLPLFRKLCLDDTTPNLDLEIIAIPPRSYGRSTNVRPTQEGILEDYRSVAEYVTEYCAQLDKDMKGETKVIWYGHSLGASIATCLLSSLSRHRQADTEDTNSERTIRCDALIFENGFSSIKDMVRTLYPQRFLPYYHLTPFVLDNWDVLGSLDKSTGGTALARVPKLFISSERDEMVPCEMVEKVFQRATDLCGPTEWLTIKDSLHDFAYKKDSWNRGITKFVDGL